MKTKKELKVLREMSVAEANKKAGDLEHELMNLRFRHVTGQLEKTGQLQSLRRSIARAKTIARELENKA